MQFRVCPSDPIVDPCSAYPDGYIWGALFSETNVNISLHTSVKGNLHITLKEDRQDVFCNLQQCDNIQQDILF